MVAKRGAIIQNKLGSTKRGGLRLAKRANHRCPAKRKEKEKWQDTQDLLTNCLEIKR